MSELEEIRLKLAMLEWLQKVTGQAVRYFFYEGREHGKWCVIRQNDVYSLLKALLPFLKIKRQKAVEVISWLEATGKLS